LLGKNYDNAFKFPEPVRDNVVSNDVTITSSLRSDMTIFGTNFQYS